jgi:hypothetical protein
MKLLKPLLLAASLAMITLGSHAATLDINGVKLEDSAEVHGTKLRLNGAGTRFKVIFKVYVAGLYLSKQASSLDEVIKAPGPKRMSVTMVREVNSEELGILMARGMHDNMEKNEMSKLLPGLKRMSQLFSDQKKLMAGDNFMIDWVPGVGTVLTVKGKVQGEPFKEPEFFKALMSIWLGHDPADYLLKDGLLGIKS